MGISDLIYGSWMKEAQYKKYEGVLPMLEKAEVEELEEEMLDIGIGPALFEEYLDGEGIEIDVVGVDPNKKMIEKAEGKGYNVVESKATELPFDDNSFKFIVLMDTIHKTEDEEEALEEVKRVLKPGGHVLVTHFCNAFTKKDVIKKLERLSKNFEVVDKRIVGHVDKETSAAYLMKLEED